MIKKYIDFVNESIELILESEVVYSDKFRNALTKVDHPLAKSILGIETKDIPVQSNYFDLPIDKNDTVSFIPDRRAQQILTENNDKEIVKFVGDGGGWLTHNIKENGSIFDALGYVPEGEVYKPNSADIGEVIKKVVSPTSGKTYCYVKFGNGSQGVYNAQKLQKVDNSKQVWVKNRQEIKIGRAVRALLNTAGEKPLDKDIETFVNLFKAVVDKLNDKFSLFSRVTGDDIAFWYNSRNYEECSGMLGSSCMSSVPDSYFSIYVENPDVCSLVIYKSPDDEDKIIGRSLLWKLTDGKFFMDRIYTINDSDVELFRQYAREMGWYHKRENSNGQDDRVVSPSGEKTTINVTCQLKKGNYRKYPYLDTLKFYDPGTGLISYECDGDCITLEDTGGGHADSSCDRCGGDGRVDCYECDGSGSVSCSDCDGSGEVECDKCDGSGKDAEGNDCTNCDGDGEVRCNNCDDGSVECSECGGDGRYDCPECS